MTLHVAFFRNMNLGQARSKSPRSAELLGAFTAAGATSAVNIQTNGTVIFSGDDPQRLAESVLARLTQITGYDDLVVTRSADWLLDRLPNLDPELPAGEVAFFNAVALPKISLPHMATFPTGELVVHQLDAGYAVTSATGTGVSAGPVLARLLGIPVTCRGVPTMIRLMNRLKALNT